MALYEGKARHGDSWFNTSEDALVVEYDVTEHEFSGFRDELREIYPGLYVGKMYAMPGASLWNGAFVVPAGDLGISVTTFVICACVTLASLQWRRVKYGAELGGPLKSAKVHAVCLCLLWFVYIVISILSGEKMLS